MKHCDTCAVLARGRFENGALADVHDIFVANWLPGERQRLRDDGTVPLGNPFVGRPGYGPEIYSLGHRNTLGP